jgi:glycosyltransferase involved in cell wall biosynthesis
MKVFILPRNHEYIRRLQRHLQRAGVQVVLLRPFHHASLSNLVKLIVFSIRGFRIVHVHWLYVFPLRSLMKGFVSLCRGLGIRIIWEMHNILPHGGAERERTDSRWFFEHADGIIYHSRSDIERAKATFGTNVDKPHIVIPHGNFNESYPNTITRAAAREKLSVPARDRVILCFGFIRRNRGYEHLIEAVKDMERTTVIIAGKLEDRDVYQALERHARTLPHLRLHGGWIPDDEIQWFFNACDVVVLPYTDITTSGVIPLAYAFSRPVITSDIGGIRDVVNADTGILVPVGDAASLKNAIERMFAMDLETMGRRAHAYAKKEFDWDANARKIREFYGQVGSSVKQSAVDMRSLYE